MTQERVNELDRIACHVRHGVLDETYSAQSGHPGGSLGAADIFTVLYFEEMNIDPKDPHKADRDRFVLSKGHTAPGLYSTLAQRGYFPVTDLLRLRQPDSHLQGHPSMKSTPGVDMSTGSLGQGISAACGMALAAKVKNESYRVYALLGDGEIEEGECWEAFMFAAHYKLDNLCVIIDLNGLQIDGPTKEVMNSAPVNDKMRAFGFEVIEIDGNDIAQIVAAFEKARTVKGRPTCVLATTTKGKGVCFMENKAAWHGKGPNKEEYDAAIDEVECRVRELEDK